MLNGKGTYTSAVLLGGWNFLCMALPILEPLQEEVTGLLIAVMGLFLRRGVKKAEKTSE